MTSREECEKAYLYLLKHCYEATKKNDTYDFAPSGFKESEVFKQLIEEHFELSNVIREASDDIQTVIDLLDSKVVTMGHINVAIKKLEIIQDKLMGVKEDAE